MSEPTRSEIAGFLVASTQRTTHSALLDDLARIFAHKWPDLSLERRRRLLGDALLELIDRVHAVVTFTPLRKGAGQNPEEIRTAIQSGRAFGARERGAWYDLLLTSAGEQAWEDGEYRTPPWLLGEFRHAFEDWSPEGEVVAMGRAPAAARIEIEIHGKELAISANSAGYAHLATICAELAGQSFDPMAHWHLHGDSPAFVGAPVILYPDLPGAPDVPKE